MKLAVTLLALVSFTISTAANTSLAPPLVKGISHGLDTNDYYILHLDTDTSPNQVAFQLGLVHEGQLGQLSDHHVFSSRKTDHDIVKRELAQRKRRKRELGLTSAVDSSLDGVLFSQKQVLRKPWEKRVIPPLYAERQATQERKAQNNVLPNGHWEREGHDDAAVSRQKAVAKELGIVDPIFAEQWHLINTVEVGHDVNVADVWREGVTGKNTTVAIVDDGLDMYSDDLKDNYYAAGSYDFNDKSPEPRPRLSDDRHGTRCAGEVAAVKNDVCGVGVAYDAKIAGLRILSKAITDADEAIALTYDFHNNLIYSCSWGPPDDGRSMDAPGILIRRAMLKAVQEGRRGLGSVYVFASGNGALSEDNCNFDGYTNSIYSITVGAIDRSGAHPYYSEKCSASLVVTYSSGGGDAIHTTDVGQNQCFAGHGGTSAAAPLAAGIFALALQVRPDLTWRDMQYLVLMTAVPVNLDSGDWQDTYMGKKYSHTFAYGKVDSHALVEAAKTWKNVKPQAWYYSPWIHVKQPIPQGDVGLAVTVDITKDMLKEANLARVEHVTLTMNIEHKRRGDLSVDLISPEKVVSHMSVSRKWDDAAIGYVDWTFMSVVHWGEPGIGKWTVVVKDGIENEHTGNFTDFHLKLWGESIDASKATLLPMPDDTDDDDHDITSTTTLAASTTTLPLGGATSEPAGNVGTKPADHPDRPVKPTKQPAPASSSSSSSSGSSSHSSSSTATASQPTSSGEKGSETEHETAPSASNSSVSWLPAILKNMSTKTQIWIYVALGLIGTFCIGLGVYLYLARRRRLRNDRRDNYEFELLDEEEAEALNGDGDGSGGDDVHNEKGVERQRRRKGATRGRELYDAFADGSDEDEDLEADGRLDDERSYDDLDDSRDQPAHAGGYQDQSPRTQAATTPSTRPWAEADETQHHVIGGDSDIEDGSESEGGGRTDASRLL